MKATMSAPVNAVSEPRASVLRAESGHRTARRSRLASIGLVLILVGASVFAVWSSQATSRAARAASGASRLSEDYAVAASAVAAEESLERKYRLETGPDVQARYAAAAGMLVNALALVRRDGDAADRAGVDELLVPHTAYLAAMDRMFRATDRGDTAAVLKIDVAEVDPSFGAIQQTVDDAAEAQHHKSLGQLAHLERLETLIGRQTPLVFLAGLLLVAALGSIIRGYRREVDAVARLGGDEFAVLLPDITDASAAIGVADKLRAALERPFHIEGFDVEGLDLDVEASVGVVLSGEHGADATTLLQRADIAMYVAKSQNLGVFAYDPTVDGHSPAKLALLGDLRRALDRHELVLHYQPKVSISTGDVIGAGALVRWQHPDRGLVPPDDFIPLAEHTGLIGPLTRYVLDSALAQVRVWADAGRPLKVAVNLSARNLLDECLPAMVAELLTVHGVPAALLELEVTEPGLMTEPGRAQRLLEQLARPVSYTHLRAHETRHDL